MISAKTLVLENAFTSSQWAAGVSGVFPPNPVLPNKVNGYDTTLRKYKIGDGVTAWNSLPFWSEAIAVDPIIRVLTAGQSVPYSFTLPSNFNGKYQMSVKIDRGGGLWENYPDAKVQDLLDLVTSGGVITDYFVNRVDLYGNPDAGVNLDRMIFTFSKG